MPAITRRAAIVGAIASTAAMAVPTVATVTKQQETFDLQSWLDAAPLDHVIQYHAWRLATAVCRKNPGSWRFNINMVDSVGTVLFVRDTQQTFVGVMQDYTDHSKVCTKNGGDA